MEHNDNPEITSLMKHFFKLTLNMSCHGAGLEKSVFWKRMRCGIVTSAVENVTDVYLDLQRSKHYRHDTDCTSTMRLRQNHDRRHTRTINQNHDRRHTRTINQNHDTDVTLEQ